MADDTRAVLNRLYDYIANTPDPEPPRMSDSALLRAWRAATEEERSAFLCWLESATGYEWMWDDIEEKEGER